MLEDKPKSFLPKGAEVDSERTIAVFCIKETICRSICIIHLGLISNHTKIDTYHTFCNSRYGFYLFFHFDLSVSDIYLLGTWTTSLLSI